MIGPFDYTMQRSARGRELESAIDRAITHHASWDSPGPITLSAKGWPSDVIENVLAGYREKGWRAALVPDPRDGDFIRLDLP